MRPADRLRVAGPIVLLAARPSRQANRAPLLRFLSLQRFPAHVALNRKSHLSIRSRYGAFSLPLRVFASIVVRWSPPATASNAIAATFAHSPIRFPVARRSKAGAGITWPGRACQGPTTLMGFLTLRSFDPARRSQRPFGPAQPTCRFESAAPVFSPGDWLDSQWLQFRANQGHLPRLLGFPCGQSGRAFVRATHRYCPEFFLFQVFRPSVSGMLCRATPIRSWASAASSRLPFSVFRNRCLVAPASFACGVGPTPCMRFLHRPFLIDRLS